MTNCSWTRFLIIHIIILYIKKILSSYYSLFFIILFFLRWVVGAYCNTPIESYLSCHSRPPLCHSRSPFCHSRESGNPSPSSLNKLFSQKEGLLKLNNLGGHSSFVFPHLCLAKSKMCPPFNKLFSQKRRIFKSYVVYLIYYVKYFT